MIYLSLFQAFFLAGMFAMGGGIAVIPFLKNMIDTYHWFTGDELSTLIALSEMTPGALGVNMATYAGFMAAGVGGALVATLALVCPSIILVSVLSPVWNRIKDNPVVLSTFNAVKVSVAGLLMGIFLLLFLPLFSEVFFSVLTFKIIIVFSLAMGLLAFKKIPLIIYLMLCALMGVLFF